MLYETFHDTMNVMKTCITCRVEKSEDDFYKQGKHRSSYCKSCDNARRSSQYKSPSKEQNRAKYLKYREQHLARAKALRDSWSEEDKLRERLKRNYSTTLEQYYEMLNSQNGVCAICKTIPDVFVVDHDHKCCGYVGANGKSCGKCNRGLLCHSCNKGIGMLNDDRQILLNAIEYLAGEG